MGRIIISVFIVSFFSSLALAADAYDRVKAGTTSIGVFLDSDGSGGGNVYSPGVQYFLANNIFVDGGIRFAQGTVTSQGTSVDVKSDGVTVGVGVAFPLNNLIVGSLDVAYDYYLYDITLGGTSQSGSQDANGIGMGAFLEFFLNPRSSLGLGVAYQSFSGTFRNTSNSFDAHATSLTTGWKFYF